MMLRRSLKLALVIWLGYYSSWAQISAPLQALYSAGGTTGSTYPSSTVPTYFASVGQPMVYTRLVNTNNGGGVMNANELMFSDQTVPVVVDNTQPTISSSTNITVTANITDNESSISSASISYRSIDVGGAPTTKGLTPNGATYTVQITAAEIGELGIEYKISATSGGGTYTDANFKTVKVTFTGSGPAIPYTSFGSDSSAYQIVAVPMTITGSNTVNDVFGDDLGAYGDKTKWRMYRYDNLHTTELSGSTPIDPGKGYWLIVRSSATINAGAGSTVQASSDAPFQIDLKADWNEIGNPYNFDLSWTDVQAANSNLPSLTTYKGDFVHNSSRLKAFQGGFVKVQNAQKLIFPVIKNTSVQGGRMADRNFITNAIDQPNWRLYFNLTQGRLHNQISGLGMDEKAAEGFDILDGFNLPRFFERYVNLNHNKKEGQDFCSSDIVPPSENHTWEFSIESTSELPINLSWDNSYFGDGNKQLYLWHEALQRVVDMRVGSNYEFLKSSGSSFKVFYGDASFVRSKTDVSTLVVHTVWPNPASDELNASFSLPQAASEQNVEFFLTDMMGRRMWSRQGSFSGGYHEVRWYRNDIEAQGVYFLSITNGSTTIQRKLVLK